MDLEVGGGPKVGRALVTLHNVAGILWCGWPLNQSFAWWRGTLLAYVTCGFCLRVLRLCGVCGSAVLAGFEGSVQGLRALRGLRVCGVGGVCGAWFVGTAGSAGSTWLAVFAGCAGGVC